MLGVLNTLEFRIFRSSEYLEVPKYHLKYKYPHHHSATVRVYYYLLIPQTGKELAVQGTF